MVWFAFQPTLFFGCFALFQKGYAQLFLHSLCPGKTLIINKAEITNNGLGRRFRGTVQPDHQRHLPPGCYCVASLANSRLGTSGITGAAAPSRSRGPSDENSNKGAEKSSALFKVMGRKREGPSQVPHAASVICISAVPISAARTS